MITFATEPGVFTDFIPGEQFPGLPGGVQFPALVGESQTYFLRQNVALVKGGLLTFSYNSFTGLLTTTTANGPDSVINITALRKTGTDFELILPGNSTTNIDLSDISLLGANFSQIRVGAGIVTPSLAPATHTVNITATGYSVPVVTINTGDTVTWTNTDTIAHGIQNEAISGEIFNSLPTNMGPTQSYSHVFNVTGTFTYFDPLLPQDAIYQGVVIVEQALGYTYTDSNQQLTFSFATPVAKNVIEIDTIFVTSNLPVTILLDGSGIHGPYDVNISPPQIQQITAVELTDITDPLPDTGVQKIIRVGNSPYSTDYTSLDYLLVNNAIDWGAAASTAAGFVSSLSLESFVDKIFVSVGEQLTSTDNTWIMTVVVAGNVGVGTYTIHNGTTNALVGTFTTSPGIVPTSPIPGINLIVTDTSGTTPGDTVVVSTHVGTENQPSAGDHYFVTYQVAISDFTPKLLFTFSDVKSQYGAIVESFHPDGSIAAINNLALAAYLAMLNGAPGVLMAQTSFGLSGTSTSTDFVDAIDLLLDIDEVGTVVPLTSDSIVRSYVQVHVDTASDREHRNERVGFVSAEPGASIDELIGIAVGLADKRIVLVTPTAATTQVQDQFGNALTITVEGFFVAAALSGLNHSTRFDVATPLTRKNIVGFLSLLNEFSKPEKDRLSAHGVLTVQTIGSSFSIRQSITTSINSIEERELSVTKITDYTARAVRAACDRFIGNKLVDETPIWVGAAISNVLQSLVHDQIIQAFSSVSASVDTTRPDTIDCQFSFKPIYPVNFVTIIFSINGQL